MNSKRGRLDVVNDDYDPKTGTSGGDNGGNNGVLVRERLARLEEQVRGIREHMAVKSDVTGLEEQVRGIREHMVVKNDVTGLKVWILGGVLSTIVVVASIVAIVAKALS